VYNKNKITMVKITMLCDENFVADSLRDLANVIEESDLEYSQMGSVEGDRYVGEISVIKI
jgi:hypothetical protein